MYTLYAIYDKIHGLRNKLFGLSQRVLVIWLITTFLVHNYLLITKGLKIVSIMMVRFLLIY
jgi:hypothetical protein